MAATLPTNIYQSVITWQPEALAALQNSYALMNLGDGRYRDFQKKPANLGDTINFDINPKSIGGVGLVASFQGSKQRFQKLQCDQAFNVGRMITAQDAVFNLDENGYMKEFGRADVKQLGAMCEKSLALNIISSVPVNIVNDEGQTEPTGALHTESGPYRFANFTETGLASYQQLQQSIVNFIDTGATDNIQVVLPNTVVPGIVGTSHNQFTPRRNDETSMSWKLGEFGGATYNTSNLLPLYTAGTLGNEGTTLTVVSTNDPTGKNITQITFSGAGTDSQAAFAGDLAYFLDNVSGQSNVRLVTFYGQGVSAQQCQFRVTQNSASSAGSVTLDIFPPLVSAPTSDQNINTNIVAGMQVKLIPNHRAGIILADESFFIAMPQLPDEFPFPTSNNIDEKSGYSMRMYYGNLFGKNQRGIVHDVIISGCMVPERCMRVCLPTTF